MIFLLEKDGVIQQVVSVVDVARLKSRGYKEVEQEQPEKVESVQVTPKDENADAIEEANKPIGSGKGKK